jgi:hypothetical protein
MAEAISADRWSGYIAIKINTRPVHSRGQLGENSGSFRGPCSTARSYREQVQKGRSFKAPGSITRGCKVRHSKAELEGAYLYKAQFQGATLRDVVAWRANGVPDVGLADLHNIKAELPADPNVSGEKKHQTFFQWRRQVTNSVPAGVRRDSLIDLLTILDPAEQEPQLW